MNGQHQYQVSVDVLLLLPDDRLVVGAPVATDTYFVYGRYGNPPRLPAWIMEWPREQHLISSVKRKVAGSQAIAVREHQLLCSLGEAMEAFGTLFVTLLLAETRAPPIDIRAAASETDRPHSHLWMGGRRS